MVTASTPGTVRSRSTSARCDCLPRASSYPARPGSTSASNPPSRRNPGSAVAAEIALFKNSPPDASRRSESATWPTTRALPILTPPGRRPSSPACRLRSVTAARPVKFQAGQAPKTSEATRLNPTVPTRTRQSRASSGRLKATGSTGRTEASSAPVAHVDSNSPTTPPANARSSPSVSSCRVRRPLPPPSDDLMAISCRRKWPRASSRLARLRHATSRTIAGIAIRSRASVAVAAPLRAPGMNMRREGFDISSV